jgi:hypothetical protein
MHKTTSKKRRLHSYQLLLFRRMREENGSSWLPAERGER